MSRIRATDLKSKAELVSILEELRRGNLQKQISERGGEQQLYLDQSKKYKPLTDVTLESTKELKDQISKAQESTTEALVPLTREIQRRNDIIEDFQQLPITAPEPAAEPKRQSKIDFIGNPNAGFTADELNSLDQMGFKSPTEAMGNESEIVSIIEEVNHEIYVLAGLGKSNNKKRSEDEKLKYNNEKEILKKYRERLRDFTKAQKEGVLTKPKSGKGVRNYMKLDKYGYFGDLRIDTESLIRGKLLAYDDDDLVLEKTIDKSFYNLITKRYNYKVKYSKSAINIYQELVKKSSQPLFNTLSKKTKIINNQIFTSSDQLLKELELLISSYQAGNTGVSEDISRILDALLKCGEITKAEYKKLYKKYC
jgi:hypothetical protein